MTLHFKLYFFLLIPIILIQCSQNKNESPVSTIDYPNGILFCKKLGSSTSNHLYSLSPTSDGNFILSGSSNGAWLVKANSNGDVIWSKTFSLGTSSCFKDAKQTSDGGFICVGWMKQKITGYTDQLIFRTDSKGDTVWIRTFGTKWDDRANSVLQLNDGGFLVSGNISDSTGFNQFEIDECSSITKFDQNGNLLWSRALDRYMGWISSNCLRATQDGGYILVGESFANPDAFGGWMKKIDSQGNVLWSHGRGRSSYQSLLITPDNGCIVCGYTEIIGTISGLLVKYDNNGKEEWSRLYNEPGKDNINVFYSIQPIKDQGYILCGADRKFRHHDYDAWLIKINLSGDVQWSKVIDVGGYDTAISFLPLSEKGFLVAGNTGAYGYLMHVAYNKCNAIVQRR